MMGRRRSLSLCVLAVVGCAGAAFGQTDQPAGTEPRVYEQVFGAETVADPFGQVLDLTTSVYNEYGNEPSEPLPGDILSTAPAWFSGVRSDLRYGRRTQFSELAIRSEALARYYQDGGAWTAARSRTDAELQTRLGSLRRTTLAVSGTIDRDPYYTLPLLAAAPDLLGGEPIRPTSRDDSLARQDRYVTRAAFDATREIGRRTSMSLEGGLRRTDTRDRALDVQEWTIGTSYVRRVTQHASIRLGYAYQESRFEQGLAPTLINHSIDVGVDYERPLSRSRRTTLRFSTGSNVITFDGEREIRFDGTLGLHHQMGRTWFLDGRYDRGVQAVEGFAQPFLFDMVEASAGGYLHRRLEMHASGGYSVGSIGFTSERFDLVEASLRFRLGLTRYVAVDLEGLAYEHDLPDTPDLAAVLDRAYDRRSVRANLILWLPLIR